MDVQGNRQMQPTQERHGIRWQLQPKVIERMEVHEQLRRASLSIQLLQEGLCPSQLAESGRPRTSQSGAASFDGVSVTT
jgi:hypothetical protein